MPFGFPPAQNRRSSAVSPAAFAEMLDKAPQVATVRLGSGTADSTTFLSGDRTWKSAGGGGPHTHPESDIVGLVADLAGKAATTHTHAQADVTGLVSALSGKASTSHSHAQADVTNLVTDLAGKAATSHTHVAADIGSGVGVPIIVRKTADQTAIGTAYASITGMDLAVSANTSYGFMFAIIADADAVTTGIDLAVTGPASPTAIVYTQTLWSTATAQIVRPATAYDANSANAGSAGTSRALYVVEGIFVNGSNSGNLTPRIKRENVGTGPNVRVGSYGMLWKLP